MTDGTMKEKPLPLSANRDPAQIRDYAAGGDMAALVRDFKKEVESIIIEFTGFEYKGDPMDFDSIDSEGKTPDGSDWRAYGNRLKVMSAKVMWGDGVPPSLVLEQCSKVSDHMKIIVFGTGDESECGIDPILYDEYYDLRPHIVHEDGVYFLRGNFNWDSLIGDCIDEWWPKGKKNAQAPKSFPRPVSW